MDPGVYSFAHLYVLLQYLPGIVTILASNEQVIIPIGYWRIGQKSHQHNFVNWKNSFQIRLWPFLRIPTELSDRYSSCFCIARLVHLSKRLEQIGR